MKNFYIRFLLLTVLIPLLVAGRLNYYKILLPAAENIPTVSLLNAVNFQNEPEQANYTLSGISDGSTSVFSEPSIPVVQSQYQPQKWYVPNSVPQPIAEVQPLIESATLATDSSGTFSNNESTIVSERDSVAKAPAFATIHSTDEKANGNDPIVFRLKASKDSIAIGEELELTITAELLPVSPQQLYTFEELKDYTIKVVLPNGFVQTGGDYYDYLRAQLNANTRKRVYTLRGYFTSLPIDNTTGFTLIRTNGDFNDKNTFVKKAELIVTVYDAQKCKYEAYHLGSHQFIKEGKNYISLRVKGNDKYLFSDDGVNFSTNSEFEIKGNRFNGYVVSERNLGCPQSISEDLYIDKVKAREAAIETKGASLSDAIPICNQTSKVIIQDGSAPTNVPNWGCLAGNCSPPSRVTWMYFKASNNGAFKANIKTRLKQENKDEKNGDNDLDFIVWGPFDNKPVLTDSLSKTQSTPFVCAGDRVASGWCSYSRNHEEKIDLNLQKDKFYVLLVSNYWGPGNGPDYQTFLDLNVTTGADKLSCEFLCDNLDLSITAQEVGEQIKLIAHSSQSNVNYEWSNGATTKEIYVSKYVATTYTVTAKRTGCANVTKSIGISSFKPTITGLSVSCPQCPTPQPVTLSTNCPAGSQFIWDSDEEMYGTVPRFIGHPTITVYEGIYNVGCSGNSPSWSSLESNTFTVKNFTIQNTSGSTELCDKVKSISLTALNCPDNSAESGWFDGTTRLSDINRPFVVTADKTYTARCKVSSTVTYQLPITITKCTITPAISIKETNGTSLCAVPAINLVAEPKVCQANTVRWHSQGKDFSEPKASLTLSVKEQGVYYATCSVTIVGVVTTATSNQIIINSQTPSAPTITGNPTNISLPEVATLSTDGCKGVNETIKWYRVEENGYSLLPITGTPVKIADIGVYFASCFNSNCGESPKSNEIKVTAGLTLKPDLPGYEAVAGQTFAIKAMGCPAQNSKIQWKKDGAYITDSENKNPLSVSGPGTYAARCVPTHIAANALETEFQFTTITITLKQYDKPKITANQTDAYDIDVVTLTASGCPGNYSWNINGTIINNVSTVNVTGSGAYLAACLYSGPVTGPWERTIINAKNLDNIQLTSDKVKAFEVESVSLNALGCNDSRAGIQWKFGETYVSGRNQTVTGPGTYQARCVMGNQTSEWVYITIHPNTVDAIAISASKYNVYDNENITLTASGCTSSLAGVQWDIFGDIRTGNTTNVIGAGTYRARCVVGNQVGPWAEVILYMLKVPGVQITTNKDAPGNPVIKVGPFEQFIATATGCTMGSVQWETKAGFVSGSPVTFTGPGRYRARCVVTDRSAGPWSEINIETAPPGAVNMITSKSCVFTNEAFLLTTNGCSDGTVNWVLPSGATEIGRTLSSVGPGTYKVFCNRFGVSGPETSINVTACQPDAANIATDKLLARPSDLVNVSLSGCNPATYYAKVIFADGSHTVKFEKAFSVQGPVKIEAACTLPGGGIGPLRTAEVLLAPGDALRIVSNKKQVAVSETATLTAYGCDYGQLQWKWGSSGTAGNVNPLTVSGPGYYSARCVNDPGVAPDWSMIYLAPAGDIGAIVTGAARVCPNNPVTLTATGCPVESNGQAWYYQWYTAERGWNNFSQSITVYLPQTVAVRCNKPDNSYYSDPKEISIESPFSESFKASNNGPVTTNGSVTLTATAIEGATYKWYYPDGTEVVAIANKITFGAGGRTVTITNPEVTYSGVYTVKAKVSGANPDAFCETTGTTDLMVSLCDDFVLRAQNPITGEYTSRMPRKPNTRDQFDKLVITLETYDGVRPLYLKPVWTGPNGSPQQGADALTVEAPVMGTYKATIAAGCEVVLDISSQPCTLLDDSFKNCGDTGAVGTIDNNKLKALSVGDYFNAGDYEVKVTEVTGNEVNGWTGKGYTTLTIKGDAQTDVAVEFTGIQIDQCYQLKSGITNKVSVQYDPTWGNFIEPSKFIELLGDFYEDFEKAAQTYGASSSSIESKEAAAMLLESGQKLRDSIQDDYALTDAEKAPALAELDELLSSLSAYSSSNTRVASTSFDFPWGRDLVTSIYDKYLGKYFTKISQALSSSPVDGGFIPKSLYENDGTLAFYSGLLDGGYIALKETGTSVWQLAKVVSCLNATAFFRDDCKKMVTDSWEAVQGLVGLFNKDAFEKVWGGVVTQVGKFIENNVGMAPMNRYYNGRTAFEIASMFIGAGTITVGLKAMKAAKLAEVVQKVSEISNKLDVTSKIMSKAGVAFKKGAGKTGKFIIRNATGGIAGEAMEYVNGVYKKVKKKTSAHNQYLGTIEGEVEFADGTKGKGTYDLWGICAIGSNLRVNANPPKGKNCDNVSEVGVELAKNAKSVIPKGFTQTKKFGYQHGQKVYEYKGKYYSKDVDSHNGGAWKVFEEVGGKLKRIGTADENLNIFKR
ncbi:toxin C-terminal domain-containing protein [Emticicia sp. 21SJ11W-3]|uniref:toxin C-terminal domain-containing protein n=1 Tax=Emticicia sp. 21SJ11W-3 TaxID=2916755 RepID=UPI00209D94E8|nr:toxin C-terminal domain-containing protein [Emticicia sp. 21SJ11W-3]UTA66949.1 toxin C-terminal domain-containing protein [Emticicia sp. 21SJ11W-3]